MPIWDGGFELKDDHGRDNGSKTHENERGNDDHPDDAQAH